MTKPLADKVAIVSGASRGIGRAVAVELARRGALVAVNYNINQAAADDVVSIIKDSGSSAIAVKADVSQLDHATRLVKETLDAFGRVDILVNNAGITRDRLLMMMGESDWDEVIRINLKTVFNCSKAVARPMMRQKQGRIINISSVSGVVGQAGQTNYSASKAGMIGFTKSLAKELGQRGITVNAVAPGFVVTDLTADLPSELMQKAIDITPLRRMGKPEEIAYAVAFLASDEAAFITGEVLTIDGGLSMSS